MYNSSKNSGGQIANAIIIPMVVIVMISVVGIFGLLHWSARLSDETAVESQNKLISGALQLTQNYMVKQQNGVVIWDEAYHRVNQINPDEGWIYNNLMHWLFQNHGFSKSILINRDYGVQYVYAQNHTNKWMTQELLQELKPAVAKVRARYIISFRRTPSGSTVSFRKAATRAGRLPKPDSSPWRANRISSVPPPSCRRSSRSPGSVSRRQCW